LKKVTRSINPVRVSGVAVGGDVGKLTGSLECRDTGDKEGEMKRSPSDESLGHFRESLRDNGVRQFHSRRSKTGRVSDAQTEAGNPLHAKDANRKFHAKLRGRMPYMQTRDTGSREH
jgi:hypothetical protein